MTPIHRIQHHINRLPLRPGRPIRQRRIPRRIRPSTTSAVRIRIQRAREPRISSADSGGQLAATLRLRQRPQRAGDVLEAEDDVGEVRDADLGAGVPGQGVEAVGEDGEGIGGAGVEVAELAARRDYYDVAGDGGGAAVDGAVGCGRVEGGRVGRVADVVGWVGWRVEGGGVGGVEGE